MKNLFIVILLSVFAISSYSQKKLTPISKSAITGIDLPAGSKQDERMLSLSGARILLGMESDKTKTTLRTPEVLTLPPVSLSKFDKSSLVQKFTSYGWKTIATEDENYLWLQKDNRYVITYFSMDAKETNLYFAETNSAPDFSTQTEKSSNQYTTEPVTQAVVEPNTQAVIPSPTQTIIQPNQSKANAASTNSSIVGTWRRGQGVTLYGGRWSSTGYQYIFNANGTYTYVIKTYVEDDPETLLTRESGIFTIIGNTITLDPKTNVIEAWSKSNGGDNYKSLITTQNKPLEKITYQFTLHYFPELKETDLVLIYGNETIRDGKYNASDAFPTGWRFSPAGSDYQPIKLPGEQQTTTEEIKKDPAQKSTPVTNGKFAFSTTNFDNGWTSTVQEDWVEVVKGNVKVLIHYPNKNTDAYNPVLMDGLKNAWNILVAPKYSSASNFEFKPISSWQSIEFAEADAVEKTGKSVHVVLFKMNYSNGSGKYLEFITPDKKTYELEFGAYHETSYGWEKVEAMANYNKFAIAATDLAGKWTNDYSGMLQYVNANTGASAGASSHASTETFEFGPSSTYTWDLGVASGMVGNIKFQSVKSNGKFSLPSNWQVTFSDIEGKPRTYNAFFSCVKGLRILWLDDRGFARIE